MADVIYGGVVAGMLDGGEMSPSKPSKKARKKKFGAENRTIALSFLEYVNSSEEIRSRSTDREDVGILFEGWAETNAAIVGSVGATSKKPRFLCSRIMTVLRQMKLLQSKRRGDVVLCLFALSSTPGDYPTLEERRTTREELLRKRRTLESDKGGVAIVQTDEYANSESRKLVPSGQTVELTFELTCDDEKIDAVHLNGVSVSGKSQKHFAVNQTSFPMVIAAKSKVRVVVTFRSPSTGVYRAILAFRFRSFKIVRYITIRSGDPAIDDILKPSSPYKKRKQTVKMGDPENMVPPPKRSGGKPTPYKNLPHSHIPYEVIAMIEENQLEDALETMDKNIEGYADFWRLLLWASEFQAKRDITLFDMIGATLVKSGRSFILAVPGLAEGRPSVLRGDIVIVNFKGRAWKGRVESTRLEEVVLEFDPKLHRQYRTGIDTVDVRFTLSRTTFRTSHDGCLNAPASMGKRFLFPESSHLEDSLSKSMSREIGRQTGIFGIGKGSGLKLANAELNAEQRAAVINIVKGAARPLPYIIFGPPGTGKTTTVVETIYQIARHEDNPRILLVAPSNDAADILVEKLSSYFPPSEMRRIIALSRSITQVSPTARPYATEGLSGEMILNEINSSKIVVSTVNLAARFAYNGVQKGLFDVVCVDEAGHATEPEIIAVASTLMHLNDSDGTYGQLILAGDPRQLGPVITSTICQKQGMGISFMERLANRDVYGRDEGGEYRSELITKLVRNYRSHPSIIDLPNKMFYDGELQVCGDQFKTHGMCKWEHLPVKNFPVMFHAVSGENLREGNSPSWFNPQEATVVVNYIDLLMKQSNPAVDSGDIGVITPYARQAEKIRLALKSRGLDEIKVGSVETFQGQERRCIIISTVRAESDYLDHDKSFNLGFVSNKKRFNVAVTRAASLLIVVGSPRVLATDEEHWLPLLKMCKENKSWTGEDWDAEDDLRKSEDDDDLLAEVDENVSEEDWITDGMDMLTISKAVEQESVGYVNREE